MRDFISLAVEADEHGIAIVGDGPPDRCGPGQIRRKNPARKDPRKLGDGLLIVGEDGISLTVYLFCAILIEEKSSHGKKLQNFTGVVFVGLGGCAAAANTYVPWREILAAVVDHVEESSHGRIERDIIEKLAEVAESLMIEQLLVSSHP